MMSTPDLNDALRAWEALIENTTARRHWMTDFGLDGHDAAARYLPHFTDSALAANWHGLDIEHLTPEIAAYLHRHDVAPHLNLIEAALHIGDVEADIFRLKGHHVTPQTRAMTGVILLAHPDLHREDRAAIIRSGITLTELDHLLATGTYDRATLIAMAALR